MRKIKTQCKYGHTFTQESTYVNRVTGERRCKICRRVIEKSYREMQKLADKRAINGIKFITREGSYEH